MFDKYINYNRIAEDMIRNREDNLAALESLTEQYAEKLTDELCDEEEYKHLSNEDYEKMIDEKVKQAEFVKAIVIWVG